jgi:membrane protease YdiL (CAAX protease family)
MAEAAPSTSGTENIATTRSARRALYEIAGSYGLILLVTWTPRPWQKLLWWIAVAAVAAMAAASFHGLQSIGLRRKNFFKSLWITGVALALAAIAVVVAILLHTLHLPNGGAFALVKTYGAYALWAFVQQFLLQGFFLPRCARLLKNPRRAALAAAALFALAHLPNPILTPITFIWGLAACLLFLHYRNLYPLAIAHAIFGIAIAITVPGPVDHNMRVGLGYLTYHHRAHHPAPLTQSPLTQP